MYILNLEIRLEITCFSYPHGLYHLKELKELIN